MAKTDLTKNYYDLPPYPDPLLVAGTATLDAIVSAPGTHAVGLTVIIDAASSDPDAAAVAKAKSDYGITAFGTTPVVVFP